MLSGKNSYNFPIGVDINAETIAAFMKTSAGKDIMEDYLDNTPNGQKLKSKYGDISDLGKILSKKYTSKYTEEQMMLMAEELKSDIEMAYLSTLRWGGGHHVGDDIAIHPDFKNQIIEIQYPKTYLYRPSLMMVTNNRKKRISSEGLRDVFAYKIQGHKDGKHAAFGYWTDEGYAPTDGSSIFVRNENKKEEGIDFIKSAVEAFVAKYEQISVMVPVEWVKGASGGIDTIGAISGSNIFSSWVD